VLEELPDDDIRRLIEPARRRAQGGRAGPACSGGRRQSALRRGARAHVDRRGSAPGG
jgi:hypothetical protein